MHTKFLRRSAFALISLLALGAPGGVRAAGETEPEPQKVPRGPLVPLRTLEDILARDWFRTDKQTAGPTAAIPNFGTPPLVPFLTLSRLFPAMAIGQQGPQNDGDIVGEPWTGAAGVTRTVNDIMAEQNALDAMGLGVIMREAEDEHEYPAFNPQPEADTVFSANWPPSPTVLLGNDPKRGRKNPQTVGPTNFRAVQASASGYTPPDTEAAVGPSQILMIVNGRIISFNKSGGASGGLNASADAFFPASIRNNSASVDPKVRYDRISQRWFVTSITTVSASNRIVLAVSNGPLISGAASFTFYQFQFDLPTPTNTQDNGGFADYATLGVDANAAYVGINVFKGNFVGSTLFVINKNSVTSGGPIVVTPFRQVATSNGAGLFTPQGADNDNPAATNGYVISPNLQTSGRLNFRRVLTPGGTPTLTTLTSIAVPATASPTPAPELGTTTTLDGLDLRMFAAQAHRNALTGATTLWTAHTNNVNASGISSGGSRDGTRWYEIQNLDGTPTLKQSGTLFDPAATNPLFFLCGTVAMSGQGAMALGSTATGTTSPTRVAVAGRLITDPAGAIQTQTLVPTTTGVYTGGRWGDYSFTTVDPLDDMTFWTAQMYADAANNWAVQIVQLKSPPPPAITTVSPAAISAGAATNITVTGMSSGSAAFFNPLPDYANHIAATTSAPGVTISAVAIVLPATPTTTPVTQVTMNITVPANTPAGNYNLTITNPDGQSVTANGLLVIQSPAPALTSLSPATAVAGTGAFTLTVNGANFAPNSVVNFNGAAKTTTFINAGKLTASIDAADINDVGTYPVTVSTLVSGTTLTSAPLSFAVNQVFVAGAITLEGLSPAPLFVQPIQVDFRMPGTTTVLFTRAAAIGSSSLFSFSGITPGVYDIAFKGVKYLRRVVRNIDVSHNSTSSIDVTLIVGDSDDNNIVDIGDFGVLINAYASPYDAADPMNGYDTAADLNDDGLVDIADFGLLVNNYGASGAP